MTPVRFTLSSAFLVLVVAAPVLAQAQATRATPQLVSPGAERRPALAAPCPGFSWAPIERAQGYELSVHEWLDGQLSPEPVTRTTVPGRSASWTPASNNCFRIGGTYLWFLRETDALGEPIGAWSSGLAFRVADPADAVVAATASKTTDSDARIAAQPPVQPPENSNGNPPDSVQDQLAAINRKLDDLLSPHSFEVCVELGAEGEIHTEFGGDISADFKGEVGAEAFGNGVTGKLSAKPGWGFGAQIKGALVPKVAYCFDLLSLGGSSAGAQTSRFAKAASTAGLSAVDTNTLAERVLTLATQLNLNGDRLTQAMDLLPNIAGGVDPWSAFRSDGPIRQFVDALPLPAQLAETLKDPGQVIANFRSQLALCSNGNLPPVIADVVGQFCTLANNEPFRALLNRVDIAVGNLTGAIDSILSQLPTGDSCKFFCRN